MAGNLMDQNENGVQGEALDDAYGTSLVYIDASVTLSTDLTISETEFTYDGEDLLIDGATVAIDGPHSFNSIHVVNGGKVTHSANTETETHLVDLSVVEQVIVDSRSSIDVSEKGYLTGRTTGNTTDGGATGSSAGSYGGVGDSFAGSTNAVYGDFADPDDWGSGGNRHSAAGGGLVRITAEAFQLDGSLFADGQVGSSTGGGGSGGGIYVAVNNLTGSGSIQAAGASGRPNGGGGGRVAVYAQDFGDFDTDAITAPGAGNGTDGSVHIVQGLPHTHVRFHGLVGPNNFYVSSLDQVVIEFNKPIDGAVSNAVNLRVDGPLGHFEATGIAQIGDRLYQFDVPAQVENGYYNFTVLPTLLDAEGFPLDQNTNGIPGEYGPSDMSLVVRTTETLAPNDFYEFTLILDTVAPRVTNQTPARDLAGTIEHVDIWFSETIDKATFTTDDIVLTDPLGQPITVNPPEEVGLNRFRISFPPQTIEGLYELLVGPDIADPAGNPLNQDGDDDFGEPEQDVYRGGFNLVELDLQLSNVAVTPSPLWAGEEVTISWDGQNATGAPLVGDWIDGVYLSTDDQWDIMFSHKAVPAKFQGHPIECSSWGSALPRHRGCFSLASPCAYQSITSGSGCREANLIDAWPSHST
ncbi:MAG: hypothetical protein ACC628_24095 [Pirellulaceae bacterium]